MMDWLTTAYREGLTNLRVALLDPNGWEVHYPGYEAQRFPDPKWKGTGASRSARVEIVFPRLYAGEITLGGYEIRRSDGLVVHRERLRKQVARIGDAPFFNMNLELEGLEPEPSPVWPIPREPDAPR